MRPIAFAFLSAVTLSAFVQSTPSALAADTPQALSFTVLRDGQVVGSHVLKFQEQVDGVGVSIDTNVVVKMAMIPVYRFEHHGQEIWRQGHLVSLKSTTNDDGTHHSLTVAANAMGLDVSGDGNHGMMPAPTLPASLWNQSTISQGTLLNTLDGRAMHVSFADLGQDNVSVHGQTQPAHHFAMTGDLARELWYDDSGTLVQVRFKAKDDSDIRYVLK